MGFFLIPPESVNTTGGMFNQLDQRKYSRGLSRVTLGIIQDLVCRLFWILGSGERIDSSAYRYCSMQYPLSHCKSADRFSEILRRWDSRHCDDDQLLLLVMDLFFLQQGCDNFRHVRGRSWRSASMTVIPCHLDACLRKFLLSEGCPC